MSVAPSDLAPVARPRRGDWLFYGVLGCIGGSYVLLIALLLIADAAYVTPGRMWSVLRQPEIQFAIRLTLFSCTTSAILSLAVGVALGCLLARHRFPGKWVVETLLDIPLVLPPLVLGLCLLILFHLNLGGWRLEDWLNSQFGLRVTYDVPAVILAQFAASGALAVRTMRVVFEGIGPRGEQVARTLGCSRARAFFEVALPQAGRGMLTAFAIAWARSLGEFGPILVFAGTTRRRTEVLSTSVYLEWSVGNIEAAAAVSLLMVLLALLVLGVLRLLAPEPRP